MNSALWMALILGNALVFTQISQTQAAETALCGLKTDIPGAIVNTPGEVPVFKKYESKYKVIFTYPKSIWVAVSESDLDNPSVVDLASLRTFARSFKENFSASSGQQIVEIETFTDWSTRVLAKIQGKAENGITKTYLQSFIFPAQNCMLSLQFLSDVSGIKDIESVASSLFGALALQHSGKLWIAKESQTGKYWFGLVSCIATALFLVMLWKTRNNSESRLLLRPLAALLIMIFAASAAAEFIIPLSFRFGAYLVIFVGFIFGIRKLKERVGIHKIPKP